LLLLFFSIGSMHALALIMPPCTQCPPGCPMHAKQLGCHHGAGAARREPGLRCARCTHHTDGPVLSDQPVVLSARTNLMIAPPRPSSAPPTFSRPAAVALDPPFHPPRITDLSV